MATFKIGLGLTETQNSARFEVSGSDEWVQEVMPYIAYIVGAMVKAHGQDADNMAAIGNEISAAQAALAKDQNYSGDFITVTRGK